MKKFYCSAISLFFALSSLCGAHAFDRQDLCFADDYRCVIDIGSIATKIGCTDRFGRFRFEAERPVAYRADLKKQHQSGRVCFSDDIKEHGSAAVSYLIASAVSAIKSARHSMGTHSAEQCTAICNGSLTLASGEHIAFHAAATASLRADPVCGNEIVKKITAVTGVPVTIIDQDREGMLAFRGIIACLKRAPHETISWDLGGGSTQIITADRQGSLMRYLVEEGMFFFRDVLIKAFGKKEEDWHDELSLAEIRAAVALAEQQIATRLVRDATLQTIKKSLSRPRTRVIGTDGVVFVIKALTQNEQQFEFTRDEIERALERCADSSDQELGKRFNVFISPAFVSGAALLVGYMKALDIHSVTLLSDGALRAGALIEDAFFSQS